MFCFAHVKISFAFINRRHTGNIHEINYCVVVVYLCSSLSPFRASFSPALAPLVSQLCRLSVAARGASAHSCFCFSYSVSGFHTSLILLSFIAFVTLLTLICASSSTFFLTMHMSNWTHFEKSLNLATLPLTAAAVVRVRVQFF